MGAFGRFPFLDNAEETTLDILFLCVAAYIDNLSLRLDRRRDGTMNLTGVLR